MGRLADTLGDAARIALDTTALIYYLEDEGARGDELAPLFERVDEGSLVLVISTVSVAEVLTGPQRAGMRGLVAEYKERLQRTPGIEIVPATFEVAEVAAELRALHGLQTPDAFVVASARAAACSHLVTNDLVLRKVGDPVVLLLDEFVG